MSPHNTAPDPVIFSARLSPYRSMGSNGFKLLIGIVCSVFFTVGIVFFVLGSWPVLGFMGLDVLLVYWAFKSNFNAARAYEEVDVSRQRVLLRKVAPNGSARQYAFPRLGTRFEVERHNEIGITKMRLARRETIVEFGQFLNPPDRESFVTAFDNALASAKQ